MHLFVMGANFRVQGFFAYVFANWNFLGLMLKRSVPDALSYQLDVPGAARVGFVFLNILLFS